MAGCLEFLVHTEVVYLRKHASFNGNSGMCFEGYGQSHTKEECDPILSNVKLR